MKSPQKPGSPPFPVSFRRHPRLWSLGLILAVLPMFFTASPVSSGEIEPAVEMMIEDTVASFGISDAIMDFNVRIPMTKNENPVGYDCDLWATTIYHSEPVLGTDSAKRPTILLCTAYRREIMGMMRLLPFLWNDYNIVMVDMRGTGSGEGVWDPLGPIEAYDVAYIVDQWIPSQPWSDGRVGMVGGSYEGILQYLAAGLIEQEYCPEKGEMVPKHLKAISPLSAYNDVFKDIVIHGGNFEMEFMAVWIFLTDFMSIFPPNLMYESLTKTGFQMEDWQEMIDIWEEHSNQLTVPLEWIVNPERDRKVDWYELKSPMLYWPRKPEGGWDFPNMPPEVGGNVLPKNLPVFTATGWFDIFTRGSLNNYEYGLVNHDPSDKAMIIGPWYHIDAAFTFPGVTGMGLLGKRSIFSWDVLVRWFDWKLKGKNDPFMEEYPVALYVLGEEKWRAEKSWPLPESRLENKTCYLSKASPSLITWDWFSYRNWSNNYKLVSETSDSDFFSKFLWFKKAKANPVLKHDPTSMHGMSSRSAQRWFGFSPSTILTQIMKYMLKLGDDSKASWEDERDDETGVLTFTTEPLEEDVEISGPLKLTFWAETVFDDPMAQAKIDSVIDEIRGIYTIDGQENLVVKFCDRKDVQWVAEVNDVFPNGRARNITSGWLSSAYRPYDPANPTQIDPKYTAFDPFYDHADKNPSPIAENKLYKYVVEIWPTTNVFKKGHRIRLSLSGSDFPHLFPVLRPSSNTLVIDENHKAKLDYKVVNKKDEGRTWKWIEQKIGDYLMTER